MHCRLGDRLIYIIELLRSTWLQALCADRSPARSLVVNLRNFIVALMRGNSMSEIKSNLRETVSRNTIGQLNLQHHWLRHQALLWLITSFTGDYLQYRYQPIIAFICLFACLIIYGRWFLVSLYIRLWHYLASSMARQAGVAVSPEKAQGEAGPPPLPSSPLVTTSHPKPPCTCIAPFAPLFRRLI